MTTPIQEKIDLSKYIEKRFFEDRPHIRGYRIPVTMIVMTAHSNHWDVTETAYQFSLSETEILAAMLYYEQHRDEIHQQEIAEKSKFDEMKRLYGSD